MLRSMFMHVWKEKGRKVFLSLMAFAFLLVGGIWYAKEYTTVGNSVNGRGDAGLFGGDGGKGDGAYL